MKLVFLNRYFHPDISATSQVLTDLALDQARRGREVHVITSRQLYEDAWASLAATEEHGGVLIHRVRSTRFGRRHLPGRALDYATFFWSATIELFSLAREGDIIVAKTDPPLISVAAAWVARRRHARLVNWLQDVFPEVAQRLGVRVLTGPLGRLARAMRDYSLRTAVINVAVGQRMADAVTKLAGTDTKVLSIENWADGNVLHPVLHEANPLRREWGLEGKFVIGYSGNMGRAHEFATLMAAAKRLARSDPGVRFLFIGGGRRREEIAGEVVRQSLDNIAFLPYQPRDALAFSLSAPDLHLVTLHPALEGLIVPSKFYGVAAVGRPTIFVGDPSGEIARLLARERCGVTIHTGDVDGLVAAIQSLRKAPAEVAAMGRRARAAFESHWDLPHAMARWDAALRL